jgi:serine protease Do
MLFVAGLCLRQKRLFVSLFSRILAVLALFACDASVPAQISRVTPVVQVVRKCRQSVVAIFYPGAKKAVGAGIIIHEKGYVMTDAHVVGKYKLLPIMLFDGAKLTGTVLVVDHELDLAIIRLDTDKKLTALFPSSISDLEVGETAIAIGCPFGYPNTVTVGIISALNRNIVMPNDVTATGLIQFDVPINPGNSGGPLLDINGDLIGIVVATRDGGTGISFATNAKTMKLFYAKHVLAVK